MSSTNSSVKLSLGGGSIGSTKISGNTVNEFVDLFHKHGHTEIDAAAAYPPENFGQCERELANLTSEWPVISTKLFPPFTTEGVTKGIEASLERLGRKEVDILYLHFPDGETPLEETMRAVDEAHRAGKFKKFGVSNYSPEKVGEMVEISEKEGFVKPSVYQGQYNCLARRGETGLLPLLRKHGIAYYAYSPAAAGMLTGKVTRESSNQDTRWNTNSRGGQMYSAAYHQDLTFEAVDKIRAAAEKHGIAGHAAGLRWCMHHSALTTEHGDAVIIGASSVAQLEENLKFAEQGPLPEDLVKVIEGVWPNVEPVAAWAWV